MGVAGRGVAVPMRNGQYWDIQYSPAPHIGNYARAGSLHEERQGQKEIATAPRRRGPLKERQRLDQCLVVCGASKERGGATITYRSGTRVQKREMTICPSVAWTCPPARFSLRPGPGPGPVPGRQEFRFKRRQRGAAHRGEKGEGGQQGVLGGLLPERGSRRGSPDVEILPAWTRRGQGPHTCLPLLAPVPRDVTDGLFFSSQVCGIPGGARGRRGCWQMTCGVKYWFLGGRMGYFKGPSPRCPPLRSRQQGMAVHEGGVWTATAGQGGDPEASALGLGRRDGNVMSGVHVQVAGRGGNLALLSRLARLLDIPPGPRATRHADRAKFPVTHTSIGSQNEGCGGA
jgi:hypothetical protein